MENEGGVRPQRTVRRSFSFEGVGLHTGKKCRVAVSPLPAGSGIRFFRSDLGAEIPLSPHGVTATVRGTTLTGEKGASIHTVEHFLAATHGLGVDNLRIEMDSEEMPILDGSAAEFCRHFREAGVTDQGVPAAPLELSGTVELDFGEVSLRAEPARELTLEVMTSFPYPGLGDQKRLFRLTEGAFERELAPARTFCFEEEVQELRAQGLIKGGNLACALVIGKKGLLNGPFRFEDEIVRHKTLDLLGDLTLLNRPLWAKITVKKAGHRYHVELAKAILEKCRAGKNTAKTAPREGSMLDILEIQKILPHRYPFLMVDRILELEPNKRVVGIKNVAANEPYFQGHFPGHPIMPGVLVLEAMAQTGGIALLRGRNGDEGKLLYLTGVDNARFRRPIRPGDQVRLEVDVVSSRSKIAKVAAKALVDGQVAVEAELTCAIVDAAEVKPL